MSRNKKLNQVTESQSQPQQEIIRGILNCLLFCLHPDQLRELWRPEHKQDPESTCIPAKLILGFPFLPFFDAWLISAGKNLEQRTYSYFKWEETG